MNIAIIREMSVAADISILKKITFFFSRNAAWSAICIPAKVLPTDEYAARTTTSVFKNLFVDWSRSANPEPIEPRVTSSLNSDTAWIGVLKSLARLVCVFEPLATSIMSFLFFPHLSANLSAISVRMRGFVTLFRYSIATWYCVSISSHSSTAFIMQYTSKCSLGRSAIDIPATCTSEKSLNPSGILTIRTFRFAP